MIEAYHQALLLGTFKIGQVMPKEGINFYNPTKFQTMKNYKLAAWVLNAGETHVSLGCADFAQLLFGTFNGDLTKKIQFYGIFHSKYPWQLIDLDVLNFCCCFLQAVEKIKANTVFPQIVSAETILF